MEQKEDNLFSFKFIVIFLSIVLFIVLLIVWLMPFTNGEQLMNSFFYFFSSSAQTMGALFAIVLSSIYVLMTYLGSNSVLSMPTKRLLLKDSYLLFSVYCFIFTIILSLFGIFITKVIDTPYFTDLFVLPFLLSICVLLLSIISIITLIVFIYNRGLLYTTPEILIINDIFNNNRPEKQNIITNCINNSKLALYSEISLFSYSLGNHLKYFSHTSHILFNNDDNMATFEIFKKYIILDLPIVNKSISNKEDFYKDFIYNLFSTFNFKYILPFKCNENINEEISKNRKSVIDLLGDIFNIIDSSSTYDSSSMFYNILFNNYYYGNITMHEYLSIDLKDKNIIDFVSDFTGLLAEIASRQKAYFDKYINPFLFHVINYLRENFESFDQTEQRGISKIVNDIYFIILTSFIYFMHTLEENKREPSIKINITHLEDFKEKIDVFKDFISKCNLLIVPSVYSDLFKEIKYHLEHSYYKYYLYVKIIFNQFPEYINITNFSTLFKDLEIMLSKSTDVNYLKLQRYFLDNSLDIELSLVEKESFRYGFIIDIESLVHIYESIGIYKYNHNNIYNHLFEYFKNQLNNKFDEKYFMYGQELQKVGKQSRFKLRFD